MYEMQPLPTYSCYDIDVVIWSELFQNGDPCVCSKRTEDDSYDDQEDLQANQWPAQVSISRQGCWNRMHDSDSLWINTEEPQLSLHVCQRTKLSIMKVPRHRKKISRQDIHEYIWAKKDLHLGLRT